MVDIGTNPSLRMTQPQVLFDGDYRSSYDVGPDGQKFLMIRSVDEPLPTRINVVQNWFEELERLVPTDN